jgi:hypothetical protein
MFIHNDIEVIQKACLLASVSIFCSSNRCCFASNAEEVQNIFDLSMGSSEATAGSPSRVSRKKDLINESGVGMNSSELSLLLGEGERDLNESDMVEIDNLN